VSFHVEPGTRWNIMRHRGAVTDDREIRQEAGLLSPAMPEQQSHSQERLNQRQGRLLKPHPPANRAYAALVAKAELAVSTMFSRTARCGPPSLRKRYSPVGRKQIFLNLVPFMSSAVALLSAIRPEKA